MGTIKYSVLAMMVAMGVVMTSCGGSNDEPNPGPQDTKLKRTVLLYAIASNNLYSNLISDKEEIITAANTSNISDVAFLLYQVTPNGTPQLLELKKTESGEYDFDIAKTYDRDLYSTDPERIREVIDDALDYKPADSYGLILWSHGFGMDPGTATHPRAVINTKGDDTDSMLVSMPMVHWFGADKNSDKDPNYTDHANVDELAAAIPDHTFDFIWFDACYMSEIEVIYEFRDKCDTFVGYPTEVLAEGMPYQKTMPHILQAKSDLTGAAESFFQYFNEETSYNIATIAVCDMAHIEDVAEAAKSIQSIAMPVDTYGLQCYTRSTTGPFYDFRQVTRLKGGGSEEAVNAFNKAMEKFVVWSAATKKDFNNRPITPENFSGISTYLFDPEKNDSKNTYYKTLDWYKRVY